MRKILMASVVTVMLLAAGQAFAGFGFATGPWWMDADDISAGVQNGQGLNCTGVGAQSGTGLGLGLGYGDGTQPRPQDGTGFGSPIAQ